MFKKYVQCFHCKGKKQFPIGSVVNYRTSWDCPACNGKGSFEVGLIDRFFIALQYKLHPISTKTRSSAWRSLTSQTVK